MMDYPEREQRHHVDIVPGFMFFFVKNPNVYSNEVRKGVLFSNNASERYATQWTVIAKARIDDYVQLLILGPGPTVMWHGDLGWVRRVYDPLNRDLTAPLFTR